MKNFKQNHHAFRSKLELGTLVVFHQLHITNKEFGGDVSAFEGKTGTVESVAVAGAEYYNVTFLQLGTLHAVSSLHLFPL